ncbi:Ribonuclease P family protein [Klebsormidium nitens]|uniref:Ribonuclease P family protein n=1 Tax=Klebsormidium nitens TaxID=105231 RepID=A0A1Y1IMU1_KLENI|nr:Ribonuclease P family protein [Klebsormidium nitens]|eukprot:GAQ92200.1 Ribonuclease P family protein [Klebsormidium nitens]
MSLAAVSDAKRKRLAALEERQAKSTICKEGFQIQESSPSRRLISDKISKGELHVAGLPGSLRDSLVEVRSLVDDPSSFIESFLTNLLLGDVTRPDEIISTRVKDKIVLLDNPALGKSRRDRDAQSRTVRCLKHMSLREHRRNGTFKIPPELQRFELYEPLQAIWQEYILKLTQGCGGQALMSRLLTADYHGAFLSVSASKDPTYIGTEGLIVRETQNTFQMVTTQNRLQVVPKRGSIFQMKLGNNLVSLFGNQIVEEREFTQSGKRTPKSKSALPTIEL